MKISNNGNYRVSTLTKMELHQYSTTKVHLEKPQIFRNKTKYFFKKKAVLVKEEIIRKIRRYFEMNDNKNTTYQNLGRPVKEMLGRKLIDLYAPIKKEKV